MFQKGLVKHWSLRRPFIELKERQNGDPCIDKALGLPSSQQTIRAIAWFNLYSIETKRNADASKISHVELLSIAISNCAKLFLRYRIDLGAVDLLLVTDTKDCGRPSVSSANSAQSLPLLFCSVTDMVV